MNKILSILVLGFIATFIFISCNKNDDDNSNGRATVFFHLTDSPANYDEVNIDIQRVEIHSDQDGWIQLNPIVPGIYNLLEFSNGLDTLLCQADVPAGLISQIRLVLGNNNTVVIDGQSHALATPSAQQSGLKLNLHEELAPNGSYHFWLDFDAARSIVSQGNGSYSLKPVIRAFSDLTDGRIKGVVLPQEANAIVYAINNSDTISAIPHTNGHFMFCGLPEANYKLWIDADDATNYNDHVIPSVPVAFGEVNDVGTITLTN